MADRSQKTKKPAAIQSLADRLHELVVQQRLPMRLWLVLSPIAFIRFLGYINPRTVRIVIRGTFRQRLPSLASEMAYNFMLGLFPGILALVTAIGIFSGLESTVFDLAAQLSEVAPAGVPDLIWGFQKVLTERPNRGLFSASFAFALWASSGAMSAAMRALDQMHQIPVRKRRPFWKARLVSIALTLGTIALLIMASSFVFISGQLVERMVIFSNQLNFSGGGDIGIWVSQAWRMFRLPLALGIMSAAFAFIYRFGPSRYNSGKPLLPGALLASLAWAVISSLFRWYVIHFGNFVYSAVATLIVLLLWLWLTSLVMLIGDLLNLTVGQAIAQREKQRQKAIAPSSL